MAKVAQSKPAQRSPREKAHKKPVQRKTDEVKTKPEQVARPAYLQAKMAVSAPGDAQEQEADRVADEVSRMPRGIARKAEQGVPPGSLKPENNADMPQSLQTKISRMEEPETAQTKIYRQAVEEAQTKLYRTEEEEAQTKLYRREEQTPQPDESGPAETQQLAAPELSDEAEQKIEALRGQGNSLPENVRVDMEEKMSVDFSAVSIHTDSEANALCKQINARAFTVGNDIFFASGEYAPDTEAGRKLLAHELTHVVQQSNGARRMVMRSNGSTSSTGTGDDNFDIQIRGMDSVQNMNISVRIDESGRLVELDKIALPAFKIPFHPAPVEYRPGARSDDEENDRQREFWKEALAGSQGIVDFTQEQITTHLRTTPNAADTYVFTAGRTNRPAYNFIGNLSHIRSELTIPSWGKNGSAYPYQVDHKKELQLGGDNNVENNMWLLIGGTNIASGQKIRNFLQISTRLIGEHERETATQNNRPIRDSLRNSTSILSGYNLRFNSAVPNTKYTHQTQQLDGRFFWTYDEISSGAQLRVSNALVNVQSLDLLAGDGNVFIMPDQSRATGTRFANNETLTSTERTWLSPWDILTKVFWTDEHAISNPNLGQFSIQLNRQNNSTLQQLEDSAINIKRYPGSRFAGYLEMDRYFMQEYGKYAVQHFSPITIDSVDFVGSEGLQLLGKVNPTLGLIEGCDLDFRIANGAIEVSKTFSTSDISVPSPFSLEESSLSIFLSSTRGLGVEGRVDFGINRLGTGFIGAAASTGEGFALAGEFNFDERIFGEGASAQVRVGYADAQWSMGGTITIPEGKVPGISSATVNVDYSESGGFSARGDATLDIPGVESGTLEIAHSEEAGFSIGGSFNLSADTPGIRGGSISAMLTEKDDGSGYAVSACGEAQPDIPGINTNLIVSYDDGAFTAEVTADYSRGMLSGSVNAGVTNRTVDEDGNLSETAGPDNPLIVYGGGSLTLRLAPWLQGTAGVQFAPNGEITVTGEIGLPDQLEIFARREINKSILNIAVQVPIFAGVVAEIGGGLSATAGIGPGVIDQLQLGITYNPDHEEDTTITGDAHLNIPADAGLRLSVRAGIGLGITGASATGGLDIGGTLGIEGAAEAGVHVDWTPSDGLDLNANVAVHAQPSFTFDIGGYVSVRVFGASIYDERFEFASYTFGSDYRFGIRLPIHYHEGEPFDISLDDVEFEVPDIDTNRLLRGLIERIA